MPEKVGTTQWRKQRRNASRYCAGNKGIRVSGGIGEVFAGGDIEVIF